MYTDILILFTILLCMSLGFVYGFTHQLLSIFAWLAVIFASEPFTHWIRAQLPAAVSTEVPFLILWIIVAISFFIVATFVRSLVSRFTKASLLSPADRVLGASLGLFKGALLGILLAIFFHLLPDEAKTQEIRADFQDSQVLKASMPLVEEGWSNTVDALIHFRNRLDESRHPDPSTPWYRDFGIDRR